FPINDKAAIRLVGWYKHAPGFIDNVQSTRVFPVSGAVVDNSDRVEANFNDWTKFGVRAALGIDLNDSWTLTPGIMAQRTKSNGTFGFDASQGDLEVAHALPDDLQDN